MLSSEFRATPAHIPVQLQLPVLSLCWRPKPVTNIHSNLLDRYSHCFMVFFLNNHHLRIHNYPYKSRRIYINCFSIFMNSLVSKLVVAHFWSPPWIFFFCRETKSQTCHSARSSLPSNVDVNPYNTAGAALSQNFKSMMSPSVTVCLLCDAIFISSYKSNEHNIKRR